MDWYTKTRRKVGKPVIFIHPVTGDYKIPASDEQELPLRYKLQGYERREFNSYHEHAAWCRSKELINHYAEDVRNDDDVIKRTGKDSLGN